MTAGADSGDRNRVGSDPAALADLVRDIPDFPQPGVVFKDTTPVLADPTAFARAVDALAAGHGPDTIDKVVGIEARGFIIAAPVASRLGRVARPDGRLHGGRVARRLPRACGPARRPLPRWSRGPAAAPGVWPGQTAASTVVAWPGDSARASCEPPGRALSTATALRMLTPDGRLVGVAVYAPHLRPKPPSSTVECP